MGAGKPLAMLYVAARLLRRSDARRVPTCENKIRLLHGADGEYDVRTLT
jgi:hypothetical protein